MPLTVQPPLFKPPQNVQFLPAFETRLHQKVPQNSSLTFPPCLLGLKSHGSPGPKGALAIFPGSLFRSWLQVGCSPLTQGNDPVRVSTYVPPRGTSGANLGRSRAESRALLSMERLRGSLLGQLHSPACALSLTLCNTLQHWCRPRFPSRPSLGHTGLFHWSRLAWWYWKWSPGP